MTAATTLSELDAIFGFASESDIATVARNTISVRPPQSEVEFAENAAFWVDILKRLYAIRPPLSLKVDFYHQEPDKVLPLTRGERIRKFFRRPVAERREAGAIHELEMSDVSLMFLNERVAAAEGLATFALTEKERAKHDVPGLRFMRPVLPPMTHSYIFSLHAGQIKSVKIPT